MPALYSRVERGVWNSADFRALSKPAPNGRDLWLYLLTCNAQNPFPGLFVVSLGTIGDDLEWDRADVVRIFDELVARKMAVVDFDRRLVWLPKALARRSDEARSSKSARGWRNAWDGLPNCTLRSSAFLCAVAVIRAVGSVEALAAFGDRLPPGAVPQTLDDPAIGSNPGAEAPSMPLRCPIDAPSMPLPELAEAPSMPLRCPIDAPSPVSRSPFDAGLEKDQKRREEAERASAPAAAAFEEFPESADEPGVTTHTPTPKFEGEIAPPRPTAPVELTDDGHLVWAALDAERDLFPGVDDDWLAGLAKRSCDRLVMLAMTHAVTALPFALDALSWVRGRVAEKPRLALAERVRQFEIHFGRKMTDDRSNAFAVARNVRPPKRVADDRTPQRVAVGCE